MQKFEFLYSDDKKFVPVQLNKLNYGYAPITGMKSFAEDTGSELNFEVLLPYEENDGGFVVLLMTASVIQEAGSPGGIIYPPDVLGGSTIVDAKVVQAGDSRVFLSSTVNNAHYVYIMSEKFEDGFVSTDNQLVNTQSIFEAQSWFQNEDTRIILSLGGKMTRSANEANPLEWYNWQGSYTSPDLIWVDCDALQGNIVNSFDSIDMDNLGQIYYTLIGGSGHVSNFSLEPLANSTEIKIFREIPGNNTLDDMVVPLFEIRPELGSDHIFLSTNSGSTGEYAAVSQFGWVYPVDNHPDDAVGIHQEANDHLYTYWPAEEGQSISWYAYTIHQVQSPGAGLIQETGQLAIMQNIRFLKKMLTMVNETMWSSVSNSLSISIQSMTSVVTAINKFDDTNTVINKVSPRVQSGALDIMISELGTNVWQQYPVEQSSNEIGMITINMNVEQFSEPNKYLLSVKPHEITGIIDRKVGDVLYLPSTFIGNEELQDVQYSRLNALYGWNIEFFNSNGAAMGLTKMIVGSRGNSDGLELKISPLFDGEIDFSTSDLIVKLWAPTFESELIQVDILEHNSETLSYSLYGKRTMDRSNGIMKIYDHNGNVYKTFTMGTVSNDQTNGDIVDFRCNIEDEICLDGNEGN